MLRVVSRLQYLTSFVEEMRQSDHEATFLVKAVKGRNLNPNQYAFVLIDGRREKINEAAKDRSLEWFAEWAAPIIDARSSGRKVLIPIPSSKTVKASAGDFRTAQIADAIAKRCRSAQVAPVLRWKRPIPSASEDGGSRDQRILYPLLTTAGAIPDGECVFIDDVLTSGGHLVASVWKLADLGRTVKLAVCCGSTSHEQIPDPFAVPERMLDVTRK